MHYNICNTEEIWFFNKVESNYSVLQEFFENNVSSLLIIVHE